MAKDDFDYIDYLIQKRMQEEADAFPPPPTDKEETWKRIVIRWNRERRRPKKRWPKVSLVASLAVLFMGISVFFASNGQAFGWLYRYFIEVKNDTLNIIGSIRKPVQNEQTENSPPQAIREIETVVTKREVSLEEAKALASFPLKVPDPPPGYAFSHAVAWFDGDNPKSHKVELHYVSGDKSSIIEEEVVPEIQSYSSSVDREDTDVKEVTIHDHKALLFRFKDGESWLVWAEGQISIRIRGYLSEHDIVQVAQSMK